MDINKALQALGGMKQSEKLIAKKGKPAPKKGVKNGGSGNNSRKPY